MQVFGQSNRAVKGQPRPRPDGKMPRRGGVAHQHHVAVIPFLADHAGELHPHGRAAQMRRVGHQVVAIKVPFKDLAAGLDRFLLGHLLEAPGVPGLGQAFHDEGRGLIVELVDMRPHPAMLGLFEDEGKGVVEFLMRAEPDELAQPRVDIGLEDIGIFIADLGIDPVRGDDQIVIPAIVLGTAELGFELQVDAQFPRAPLQQDQHLLAPDPGKAMPARHRAHPVMHHRDIVPVGEVIADRLRRLGVVGLHPAQRIVRQHHAPSERVIGAVALHHRHFVRGVAQLHADREIEPRWTAAETDNLHNPSPDMPPRDSGQLRG